MQACTPHGWCRAAMSDRRAERCHNVASAASGAHGVYCSQAKSEHSAEWLRLCAPWSSVWRRSGRGQSLERSTSERLSGGFCPGRSESSNGDQDKCGRDVANGAKRTLFALGWRFALTGSTLAFWVSVDADRSRLSAILTVCRLAQWIGVLCSRWLPFIVRSKTKNPAVRREKIFCKF